MDSTRTLPWDWYPGTIPENVVLDDTAYVETAYSFCLYRSKAQVGVHLGRGASTYGGTMFDVGSHGRVTLGNYVLLNGARIICDAEIEIGDYSLISWNVVLMDTYRLPFDPIERQYQLERVSGRLPRCIDAEVLAQPIRIGCNVWIGFDVCVLPGVTIGEGAIVGARSVVTQDVLSYSVVAGNPARLIKQLEVHNK